MVIGVLAFVTAQDPRVTVSVSADTVGAGDTITIVGRLENPGRDSLRLEYSSTCQSFIALLTDHGDVLYPRGQICGAMLTSRVVPPGGSITDSLRLVASAGRAAPAAPSSDADPPILGPGRYQVEYVASSRFRSARRTVVVRD
jgi:hypothetical protein